MSGFTLERHSKYIIELSCSQHLDYDVSKPSPAQIFDSALMRIPKYGKPKTYGFPTQSINPNVPSGLICQYSIVSQKYIIDTYLEKNQFEETCKTISETHRNCVIKIIKHLSE